MKRFIDWYKNYWLALMFAMLFVGVLVLVTGTIFEHRDNPQDYYQDHTKLRYFRDDANQLCFVYFVHVPASLTTVDCGSVRW